MYHKVPKVVPEGWEETQWRSGSNDKVFRMEPLRAQWTYSDTPEELIINVSSGRELN